MTDDDTALTSEQVPFDVTARPEPSDHRLIGSVCTCGWSAGCGQDVPGQWRTHANAALAEGIDRLADQLRNEQVAIRDELSGWPIGTGYYATQVGVDEASDMAQALMPVIERIVAERLARPLAELAAIEAVLDEWEAVVEDWPNVQWAVSGVCERLRSTLEADRG